MIDFALTDEQKALQGLARDFAQREIAPAAPQLDRTGEYPFDLLRQAHKLGLLNLTIEEAYGGGVGWLEACIVGEELSTADAGFATAANANELVLTPLRLAASEEQKKKLIFQGIQFMLADMAMKIETAWLAVYYAAWMVDRKLPYALASAIAKAYGSDVAMQVTTDAVQVHGGYDYYADYKVENICAMRNCSKSMKGRIRCSASSSRARC